MIIRTADGNTTRGFRPHTDRATIAHFLDSIEIGDSKTIEKFEANKGDMPFVLIQAKISINKAQGSKYQTSTNGDVLTVRRLA